DFAFDEVALFPDANAGAARAAAAVGVPGAAAARAAVDGDGAVDVADGAHEHTTVRPTAATGEAGATRGAIGADGAGVQDQFGLDDNHAAAIAAEGQCVGEVVGIPATAAARAKEREGVLVVEGRAETGGHLVERSTAL